MNVRMMLLSGIGKPYDPDTAKGTVGRNYCYQTSGGGASLFFDDKHFNPFIGAGALGQVVDDFNGDAFDHSKLDFVGGAAISSRSEQWPADRQPPHAAGHAALGRQMEGGDGGNLWPGR